MLKLAEIRTPCTFRIDTTLSTSSNLVGDTIWLTSSICNRGIYARIISRKRRRTHPQTYRDILHHRIVFTLVQRRVVTFPIFSICIHMDTLRRTRNLHTRELAFTPPYKQTQRSASFRQAALLHIIFIQPYRWLGGWLPFSCTC